MTSFGPGRGPGRVDRWVGMSDVESRGLVQAVGRKADGRGYVVGTSDTRIAARTQRLSLFIAETIETSIMSRKSIGRRIRDFFFGKPEEKAARRQRFIQRLSLEPLEERRLLAVRVWDGARHQTPTCPTRPTGTATRRRSPTTASSSAPGTTRRQSLRSTTTSRPTRVSARSHSRSGNYSIGGNAIDLTEGVASSTVFNGNTASIDTGPNSDASHADRAGRVANVRLGQRPNGARFRRHR